MEKKSDTDIPSKGKIIKAWILLIILSACLAGLIYEKKVYKPKETNETVEVEEKIPDAIITTLNTIANNYNNNSIVKEYKEKNIITEAKLQEKFITISYNDGSNNTEIEYEYDLTQHTLTSKLENNDKKIFEDIYKLLVIACQERLDNKIDTTTYIEKALNGEEVKGLSKFGETYQIDIVVIIGEEEKINVTSETSNTEMSEEYTNIEENNS